LSLTPFGTFVCIHEDNADGSIAKLYVAPISKTATEYDIRQVFEKYGNVTEIILPKDKMTGERAGDFLLIFLLLGFSSLLITY
jgi:RNA recognition motif-containing protein